MLTTLWADGCTPAFDLGRFVVPAFILARGGLVELLAPGDWVHETDELVATLRRALEALGATVCVADDLFDKPLTIRDAFGRSAEYFIVNHAQCTTASKRSVSCVRHRPNAPIDLAELHGQEADRVRVRAHA